MLRLVFIFALSLVACPAMAARPSTLNMTCDEAQSLVASQGAAVLSTGQHTYERFVASDGYCMFDEYPDGGWAPTRDNPQCFVGYICKYRDDYLRGF